jgi:uncharacterized protein YheU (UPF0270 family)
MVPAARLPAPVAARRLVGDDDGVHIPHTSLKPEVLRAVIEEFVTREGTDYGDGDVTLDDKVKAVIAQLKAGAAQIVYDDDSQTCTLTTDVGRRRPAVD